MAHGPPYTGLRKDDPKYYTKRREMRLLMGLCEKCPDEIHRCGLCKRHYLANLDRGKVRNRARSKREGRRQYKKRPCDGCGSRDHYFKTCKLRQEIRGGR